MTAAILTSRLKKLVEMIKQHEESTLGAVILNKHGTPICYGFNMMKKSHPRMKENKFFDGHKIFLHAEISALISLDNLNKTDEGYAILVTRLSASGTPTMSKPCIRCNYDIRHSGIKEIYYTDKSGNIVIDKDNMYEYSNNKI